MPPVSEAYRRLARSTDAELEESLRASKGPDPAALAGWEFRGWNVPAWAGLLGIRKFVKGFFAGEDGVGGYNIPVDQNGLEGEWLHRPSAETPRRFGFYRVGRVDKAAKDNFYPEAVLLDYGASTLNPAWRPERVLRDYVVQPDPAAPNVLLGKAYVALGPARVSPNFFVLERLRPTAWKP